MLEKVLLVVTVFVLIFTFCIVMNFDDNKNVKREMSYSNDTEAALITFDEGYSGDILFQKELAI